MILLSPRYPGTNQNSTILKEAEILISFLSLLSYEHGFLFPFITSKATVNVEGKSIVIQSF